MFCILPNSETGVLILLCRQSTAHSELGVTVQPHDGGPRSDEVTGVVKANKQ